METLANVEEWMKSNPSKNEVEKVLNLINRLNVTKLRKNLWEKETQLMKLVKVEKGLKEISIPIPSDIQTNIKQLSSETLELRKSLPIIKKRVLKPKTEIKAEVKKEEVKQEEVKKDEKKAK